jgi:DNA repair photolyase
MRSRGPAKMSGAQEQFLFDPREPAAASVPPPSGDVVVREIRCKSLLNKCGIDDYSFNCYVGCAHGCSYCYARFMQRFHPHDEEWGRFVDARINAVDALKRQLGRLKPGSVFTCSACDGWQPIEEHYRLTRECCRLLLQADFRLNVLTKSKLVLRDLDVFVGRNVSLGVTITTPDEHWARIWEPGASTVTDRWEILKQGKAAGLKTTVMFGPLLPDISDTDEALCALFERAADIGVDRIWTDILNPRPLVWPSIQRTIREHCSHLHDRCRAVMFDPAKRERYELELGNRVQVAARNAGIAGRLA